MKLCFFILVSVLVFGVASVPIQAQTTQIQTQISGTVRPISPEMFCTNVNILTTPWNDPRTYDIIQQIGYDVLRIPGGTVANYWDWELGWVDAPRYDTLPRQQVTLADFKRLLEATDTIPVFTLNMLTSDLETQLAMLRTAHQIGIPVRYIELGNELDFPFPEEIARYPAPEDYRGMASQWATAIQAEFPDAHVSIIAASQNSANPDPRQATWNEATMPTGAPRNVAVVLHVYAGVPLPATGALQDEQVVDVLSMPFVRWEMVQQFDLPEIPNVPIWITEYNSYEAVDNVRFGTTWAQGLFTTTMALLFLEEPRIQLICSHVLTGNEQWSAFFYEDVPTGARPFDQTAQGYTLTMLGKAFEAGQQAQQLQFNPQPTATNSRGNDYPTLIGWQIQGEQRSTIILNLASESVNLDLQNLDMNEMQYEMLWGAPTTQVLSSTDVQHATGTIDDNLLLHPYSITLIE